MSCVPTTQYLDGFLDDILDKVKELEIQPHMEIRETCGKLMQRRQGLRVALRDTPAPAHRSDFVCSTLIKSRQRHEQQRSHRVVMGGGPSARFFHFLIENPPVTTPTHDLVMDLEIMLAHGQVHTIKPVVNPKRYLEGTTFPGGFTARWL